MDERVAKKIDEFSKQFPYKTYKKGDILIRSRITPPGVFYLKNGIVRCFSTSKNGEELSLNLFKAVSFFPMAWVVNNTLDNYFYGALTDVSVYIIPKHIFTEYIKKDSDIVYDLLQRIYRGLEGFMLRMESLLSNDAYYKTVVPLLIHARRFGTADRNKKIYVLKITHSQIASLAGVRRETVTRVIKKLQQKKLIRYRKNELIVKNIHNLEQEVFE